MNRTQARYDKKRVMAEQRAWVNQLIAEGQRSSWFGTMTFVFEDGVIKRGRQDKSLIPPPFKGKSKP